MQITKTVNPFVNALHVPYVECITEQRFDTTKGLITYGYEVEAEQYIRVYTLKSRKETIFKTLSSKARELYLAMLYSLNKGYTHFIFPFEKVEELFGEYSRRRYDEAIKELISYSIIDWKDRSSGSYWYNPMYFAAGDRLKLYPECKVKVKTETRSTPRQLSAIS